MEIKLPQHVKQIIETLEMAGHEAYAVGGCVRDSILGRTPEDWDITTSAQPGQVKRLFGHTVDTGIEHGTVTVLLDRQGYEVTTYRIDGEYTDSRHPKEVHFTDSLREDLRRRDFTINAMAYNEKSGLVDAFGGLGDLKDGVIRCVGDARERFGEDALRMLRAVRFAAQLGFAIDPDTQNAVRQMAGTLKNISAERIHTELVKLLVSPHPEVLEKAFELGMTAVFLPEFDAVMHTSQHNPHHWYSVGVHTLKALQYSEADRLVRLALLCHDFGKPMAKTTENGTDHFRGHPKYSEELASRVLHRLKFDNDTIRKVCTLVRLHEVRPALTGKIPENLDDSVRVVSEKFVRRLIFRAGRELYPSLMKVCRADILAQSSFRREEKLFLLGQMNEIYEEILQAKDCLSLRELAVSGADLIAAGISPGRQIGEILNRMLEDVLEEPKHNTKEYLMAHFVA